MEVASDYGCMDTRLSDQVFLDEDFPRGARPHEVSLRLDRSNLRILLTSFHEKATLVKA